MTIGQVYTCTFPLTGASNNSYALPNGGITATTSQLGGTDVTPISGGFSPACTITGNGTAQAALVCTNIPTQGGTAGLRNVPLKIGSTNPVDKGDVTLQDGQTLITPSNIGTSTDCTSSTTVNIGQTYTCHFPLTGDPGNNYTLPTGGITAGTSTATGQSPACIITGNGTAQAALVCNGIPTTGGTPGQQNVLLTVGPGGTPTDKGDVTLVQPTNPYTITGPNIGNGTCSPSTVTIGNSVTCTYPLQNIPTGQTPVLPAGGVTAGVSTPTGTGPCTIVGTNLVCTNIPTTGGTAGNQTATPSLSGSGTAPVTLTQPAPTPTNIVCNGGQPVTVNSTTTCVFTIPTGTTLPTGTQLGIGNATPGGTCTASGTTVTCTNVPTGSQTGTQPVTTSVNGGTPTNTGSTVQVNGPTFDPSQVTVVCNGGQPVIVNSTTTCVFTVPNGVTVPTGIRISIGGGGLSDPCTGPMMASSKVFNPFSLEVNAQTYTVTCPNVPTGSNTGNQPIYLTVPGSGKVDSGEKANVYDPANTVRTGGIALAIVASTAGLAGLLGFYYVSRKRKNLKTTTTNQK